jgi:hypothetical protein
MSDWGRPEKHMDNSYTMPPIKVGQSILYFSSEVDWKKHMGQIKARENEHVRVIAGICTMTGTRNISLLTFPPTDHMIGIPKSGVKHISDPDKSTYDLEKGGFWDYADATRDHYAMQDRLAALEEALEAMSKTSLDHAKIKKSRNTAETPAA